MNSWVRVGIAAAIVLRATTFDQKEEHPLIAEIDDHLRSLDWVVDAGSRIRDEGMVFHAESFVVPATGVVSADELEAAADACRELDWKVHDIVIIPVHELPKQLVREAGED